MLETETPAMILRGPSHPELLREECLPDILETTAARCPGKTALIFGETGIDYGELDRRANRLARQLIDRGVVPGDIVGLWMPRGVALLVHQAAIAKAGAGWLPFDEDTPAGRVLICMEDAGAIGVLTTESLATGLPADDPRVWTAEALEREPQPSDTPPGREGLTPDHVAYVIYTSGSTGKPKGIAITHRSICHFLRSENKVLGVSDEDTVYQGFSVAFDMSFEEIWISYLVGATLWIAPKQLTGDPDALPLALAAAGVTVLHAVPTLLSLFSTDIPSLRIINLGGEMCPESLVPRWSRPGRRMFNTYGPTEATVSASLAELRPGEPVTIGTPLPNYGLLVVNEARQPLPAGEQGELCIVGPGVAQGYLGRPELTAERFLPNPHAASPLEARLYRTGDLARVDGNGQVLCLGRVDDQVKIRGFRVELGEIEAALAGQPGVGTVAVVMKRLDEVDQLIAYVVPEAEAKPDAAVLRAALRASLPTYMVPARIHLHDELPRLTSGKIDRNALRALPEPTLAAEEGDEPETEAEAALFAALRPLFPGQSLRRNADFFTDLGGHSLLAARLVSVLRKDSRFAGLTVHEVYQRRALVAIADRMAELEHHDRTPAPEAEPLRTPTARRVLCGAAQAAVLPLLISLRMLLWLAPFFAYHYFTGEVTDSVWLAVTAALATYLATNAFSFTIAIVGKWLVLGRARPGRYPLWGSYYFRWWLADRLMEVPPTYLIAGSPLFSSFLRALGAKIGQDVIIGTLTLRSPDLFKVGDGASIGNSVNIENARVARGELVIGPVEIAPDGYVGSYAVLENDCVVEAFGHLEGLSALAAGERVPAGQVWAGAPARLVGEFDRASLPPRPVHGQQVAWLPGRLAGFLGNLPYLLGAAMVAALFFMPVFPSFMLIDWVDSHWLDLFEENHPEELAFIVYFLLSIPAGVVLVIGTMLLSAALRWLVMGRLRAGTWPVHSMVYFRKWITNQIQESSLQVLHGIYATVYSPYWYRMLGARVGKGSEISTALGVVPDMLTLGDESFIADSVMLGDEQVDGGWLTLQPTTVGRRTFIGNGAYVPDGTVLPENVLIGVQSRCPDNAQLQPGQTWLGSPPIHLPARETIQGFPEHLTFRPNAARRLARGAVEAARIVLPMSVIITAGYLTVLGVVPLADQGHWVEAALFLCLAGILYGIGSLAFVIACKWLFVGCYRPRAAPMWTPFVWLSEGVTNLYESTAVPNFLNFLRGTPLLPPVLRLLGCNIGRGVYLDTTEFTEFDCVSIGDYSELNSRCGPQTHLFEDRIMKIGRVEIGAGVTIGPRTVILYNSQVGDEARLGPLTLIVKGEQIPPASAWTGSPAQPWR